MATSPTANRIVLRLTCLAVAGPVFALAWPLLLLAFEPACVQVKGVALDKSLMPVQLTGISVRHPDLALTWPSCRHNSITSTDLNGHFQIPWHIADGSEAHGDANHVAVMGNFTGVIILDSPANKSWALDTGVDVQSVAHGETSFQQVAFCPGGTLVGGDVQRSFLVDFVDARVQCPGGELVPSSLLVLEGGRLTTYEDLCPLQTCSRLLGHKSIGTVLEDKCLNKNIQKNFKYTLNTTVASAESPEGIVLWLIKSFCEPKYRGLPAQKAQSAQSGLARLAGTFGNLNSPSQCKYTVLDISGSMPRASPHVRSVQERLRQDVHGVLPANDSNFRMHGSMGKQLLKMATRVAEPGCTLMAVTDFQDGASEDFCSSLAAVLSERMIPLVLVPVEPGRLPQPCLTEIASFVGTTM